MRTSPRTRFLWLVALVALSVASVGHAQSAERAWPTKPVKILVPFAVGGATDIVARILAPPLGEALGQQIIVENRPGAAGNIAVEQAARAAPDGYTVLIGNISTNAINPTAFAGTLKVDPTKDLAAVTLLASIPNVLVSGAAFPPADFKALIEYVRARPGELNYSNPLGSYSHLDTLDLCARTGMRAMLIPSKGAGSSVTSIINGEIHFSFLNAASVMPQIKAGKMKAFVTTAAQRLPELPEVPTMAEAGFPGVGSVNWNGLFLPAQTPRAIVNKLHAVTVEIMRRANVRDAFANAGVPITVSPSPEAFQQFVQAEVKRWARVIKENNIKLE